MSNGMAGLYIGASGLTAAQTGLNTTAHNLSNVNTEGYTRQQITYATNSYYSVGTGGRTNSKIGTGVDVQEIRRVRDDLIDYAYREEHGRLGYYSSQYSAVEEIESLFGFGDNSFQTTMNNLYEAMNEISKNPSSTIARGSLIQSATAFVDNATSIHNSLKSYQSTLNTQIVNKVNKINSLGGKIAELNQKISQIESTGEKANDLRDQRDNALDELSGYIKIQYSENTKGIVDISAEGMPFVAGNAVLTMGTEKLPGSDLITPVWTFMDNRKVFADAEPITAVNNNDIGELKGHLLARGNAEVNYENVPQEPTKPDISKYDMSDPSQADKYNAEKAKYDSDYEQYQKDCDYYNKYIDPSVVLSTMASFDRLINGMVTAVNDILCPETTASFTAEDGTVYDKVAVLDMDKTSHGNDNDKSVGIELFTRTDTDRYKKVTGNDGKIYYVRNDKNSLGKDSKYTLGNLHLNPEVMQNKAKIPLTNSQGEEDFGKAKELILAWTVKFASLSPSTYTKEDFSSYYKSLVGDYADSGQILNKMVTNQTIMRDGYNSQRQQTEGVSSDEELQNMIKFQQAYNAASRYINVVNQMLEHVVTRLGSR